MQPELYFIGAVVGAVFLIALWRLRPVRRWPRSMPYSRRAGLLSRGELAFYRVLLTALLVTVPFAVWQEYGRPISGKHVDFVLADARTTAILLVIELDDRTHQQRDRRERDEFVDGVLGSAGVPLLRVKAAGSYDVGEVRRLVTEVLRG